MYERAQAVLLIALSSFGRSVLQSEFDLAVLRARARTGSASGIGSGLWEAGSRESGWSGEARRVRRRGRAPAGGRRTEVRWQPSAAKKARSGVTASNLICSLFGCAGTYFCK